MSRTFPAHVITDDSALGGSVIQRSLRFYDSNSAYLNRTPSSAGDRRTWTWSGWVKRAQSSTNQNLFSVREGSNTRTIIRISDGLDFLDDDINFRLKTNAKFRDFSAWYHFVVVSNTTDSTSSNRLKVYVNGEQITSFSTETYPSQNYEGQINTTNEHALGREGSTDNDYLDGYMAEVNFVDGYAYDPSYFGYTDFQTKLWRPKKYEGTYGSNGFYLKFLNNDTFTSFTDTSSSARAVTRNGNVIHKSDQNKNGATSIYFDGSGDSLTVLDSSDFHVAGNDFTIEAYIRRTSQGNDEWFFVQSEGVTANTSIGLHIGSSSSGYANKPSLRYTVGGSGNELTGTTVLAANTWYHIAGVRNGNTLRIYVNGTQEASTSFSGTITDASTRVIIGAVNSAGAAGLTGYVDQVRWSNSCRYPDGTSFTAPTTQFTADSNTKLLVQSNVATHIGTDSSGNSNNFTPNNFKIGDVVEDSPTNNFCTLNLLNSQNTNLSEGNLKGEVTNASGNRTTVANMGAKSGKWYYEVLYNSQNSEGVCIGFGDESYNALYGNNKLFEDHTPSIGYRANNNVYNNGSTSSTSTTFTAGDIIGVAADLDNNQIYFYKNGTVNSNTNPLSYTFSDTIFIPAIGNLTSGGNQTITANFGQDSTFAGAKTAQGNTDASGIGDFYYSVPSGFRALCSANLPPTVPSINAQKHFDTLLYTGDGSSSNQVTGLEFKPDLVWIKGRSGGTSHVIQDVVRGNFILYPDSNSQEGATGGGWVKSFNSDGFTTDVNGPINTNNATYVAWCWKAGGAASSNSDGTITSSLSANQEAGCSIITWTGTGSAGTIGHGLGKAPKLIIVKLRSGSQDWFVNNGMIFNDYGKYFKLNASSSSNASDTNVFPNTAPTSTVFSVGADGGVNASGSTYVAYVWSEIPGYSKFGFYTGNGSADGTFVYTGFSPRFIIYRKKSDENWHMLDTKRQPKNPNATAIDPNRGAAETTDTNTQLDILSNGFKLRSSHGTSNASGTDYFYWAWAEQPGTTAYNTEANAR